MTTYLTKSSFIRGYDCPVRVQYAIERLPSNKDNDEFLKMLAEGGYQFERLVRTAWPGEEIGGTSRTAVEDHARTLDRMRALMADGGGVLHEACFIHENRFTRVDMLRVRPGELDLCEIKAMSLDGPEEPDEWHTVAPGTLLLGKRGGVRSTRIKYVADVAYQLGIVEGALRVAGLDDVEVHPRLICANKNARAEEWDSFTNMTVSTLPPAVGGHYPRTVADFVQPPAQGTRSNLILEVDVSEPVSLLRHTDGRSKARKWEERTLEQIAEDASAITAGRLRPDPSQERGWKCRDCEYQVSGPNGEPSGFERCWGAEAPNAQGFMRLYYGGTYDPGGELPATPGADWVSAAVASLSPGEEGDPGHLPPEASPGKRTSTRGLQIKAHRAGSVQYSAEFDEAVDGSLYPISQNSTLHFLDFETATACLPYTRAMRPYEMVAFQFSSHAVPFRDGRGHIEETVHHEFLNDHEGAVSSALTDDRAFIDALRDAVGDDDSPIFHWSSHERTVLKKIGERLTASGTEGGRLSFLAALVGSDGTGGRLVDMLRVAEGNIMSPHQRGRYSIKYLLPAICREEGPKSVISRLMDWDDETWSSRGSVNPYDLLPPLGIKTVSDEDDSGGEAAGEDGVRSGTDAIRAFQHIRFPHRIRVEEVKREELIFALRRYCKLDTAAMVAVWAWMDEHRRGRGLMGGYQR